MLYGYEFNIVQKNQILKLRENKIFNLTIKTVLCNPKGCSPIAAYPDMWCWLNILVALTNTDSAKASIRGMRVGHVVVKRDFNE